MNAPHPGVGSFRLLSHSYSIALDTDRAAIAMPHGAGFAEHA